MSIYTVVGEKGGSNHKSSSDPLATAKELGLLPHTRKATISIPIFTQTCSHKEKTNRASDCRQESWTGIVFLRSHAETVDLLEVEEAVPYRLILMSSLPTTPRLVFGH